MYISLRHIEKCPFLIGQRLLTHRLKSLLIRQNNNGTRIFYYKPAAAILQSSSLAKRRIEKYS